MEKMTVVLMYLKDFEDAVGEPLNSILVGAFTGQQEADGAIEVAKFNYGAFHPTFSSVKIAPDTYYGGKPHASGGVSIHNAVAG